MQINIMKLPFFYLFENYLLYAITFEISSDDDDRANACRMVLRVFKLNRGHPNTRPTLSGSLTSC